VSDTINCPNCAASLPMAAAFCTNCGNRMASPSPPPPPVTSPPPLPPLDDPTMVNGVAVSDPTQAFPAAPPIGTAPPPPPSAPWQPAADTSNTWAPDQSTQPPAPVPAWVQAAQSLASSPQPPTAPPPPSSSPAAGTGRSGTGGGSPLGAILALVGGVLTIVGTFLPWVTNNLSDAGLSGFDLTAGDKGFLLPDGTMLTFESPDPYALVALGALALLIGVMSFGATTRKVGRILAVVGGVAVIGLLVRDWMSLAQVVSDNAPASFEIRSAIGFYLAIAGGGLTALSALMPSKTAAP